MIKIAVMTDGKKVVDSSQMNNITLGEASIIVYRLEQIIRKLMDLKFDGKVEFNEK